MRQPAFDQEFVDSVALHRRHCIRSPTVREGWQWERPSLTVGFLKLSVARPEAPREERRLGEVGKGGIVKDPAQHQRVVDEVNSAAAALGLTVSGVIGSPIHGADGNAEFLAWYELR